MNISRFSIKRPVFTIVTMLFVIILGVVSLLKIPITLIPELNPPIAVVVTSYPGASPQEVNEKVTKPLEASLATLPGIKRLQSTSQESANFILLEFDWSTTIDEVQQDVLQRIGVVPMPEGVSPPQFLKFDPAQFPVMQLSLRSSGDEDIRLIAEELEKQLLQINGVASVTTSGKLVEEINIELDADALKEKGYTQQDIVQLIQANNVSLPGDPITTDDAQTLTTRIVSGFSSVEELAALPLSVSPLTGELVTLADIATVTRQQQEQTSITRANDEQAVLLSVLQESGANTAEVSSAFQEALDGLLQDSRYDGVTADILFDQGDYIRLSIANIGQSLLIGGVFAMLVLFAFLRNVKSPLIIGIAIPYSVIVTFVLMYFADFSLNVLTLGALALGIGMLVDNSIVVIENIERHLAMGKARTEAAYHGAKEVMLALIASTVTTVAVFIPILFIEGLIGQIFTEFALTISFSLCASLLVALTVVPMLASRFLQPNTTEQKRYETKVYVRFLRSVRWALKRRLVILISAVVLVAVSIFGLFNAETEFLPATDEGFVSISVALPEGTALQKTEEIVSEIEAVLKEQAELDVYVSLIGSTQEDQSRGSASFNEAEISVKLVELAERDRSVFAFSEDVQQQVEAVVGEQAEVEFSVSTSAGSSPTTTSFRVLDANEQRLEESVAQIQAALEKQEGILEVRSDLVNTAEELQITVDQEAVKQYGLLPAQVAQSVYNMTRGMLTTQMIDENSTVLSVYTTFGDAFSQNIDQIRKMELRAPSGVFVALEDITTIEVAAAPTSIRRSDQTPAVAIFVDYESAQSLGGISSIIDNALETVTLDDETQIAFTGDRELYDSAVDDMIMAVILAVVLVYLVMAAQFESFKYPFVMLFTIPLMVIGVTASLYVTNTLLGVTAVIGILVLVGIVVNNGIVLVDYINQRKADGHSTEEAIMLGVRDRVRPICMTALTTILGLVPIALGIGEGTELNQPMGIVTIGGLLCSTILTLYIVPIMYSYVDKMNVKDL
ncbi:efflux RND transporter permease subunit [Caryophanon tenue]|uniref:Cation transporter n=1 Tax=Caryophanon tenue TaxID=33978 RepID=A0A1C0YK92_9BACL|nr:efflux RND transporter permease subunit [Caryophanon tenue]OCS87499.1 cation transporter [Caryophanon tenue]